MVFVLQCRFGVLFLFLRYKSEAGVLPTKTVLSANLNSRGRERERERENSNSKTLFYKDCSLGSVKNLTTSPC